MHICSGMHHTLHLVEAAPKYLKLWEQLLGCTHLNIIVEANLYHLHIHAVSASHINWMPPVFTLHEEVSKYDITQECPQGLIQLYQHVRKNRRINEPLRPTQQMLEHVSTENKKLWLHRTKQTVTWLWLMIVTPVETDQWRIPFWISGRKIKLVDG